MGRGGVLVRIALRHAGPLPNEVEVELVHVAYVRPLAAAHPEEHDDPRALSHPNVGRARAAVPIKLALGLERYLVVNRVKSQLAVREGGPGQALDPGHDRARDLRGPVGLTAAVLDPIDRLVRDVFSRRALDRRGRALGLEGDLLGREYLRGSAAGIVLNPGLIERLRLGRKPVFYPALTERAYILVRARRAAEEQPDGVAAFYKAAAFQLKFPELIVSEPGDLHPPGEHIELEHIALPALKAARACVHVRRELHNLRARYLRAALGDTLRVGRGVIARGGDYPLGEVLAEVFGQGHVLGSHPGRGGIREEADGEDNYKRHGGQDNPEGRLAVTEHVFDAALGVALAEGQRAGRGPPPRRTALEKGLGILRALLRREVFDRALVAGVLDVAAVERPGQPDEGIVPVQTEDEEAERLEPGVPPRDVGALMRQDVRALALAEAVWQVYPGPEYAQHEGRSGKFALIHLALEPHGGAHAAAQSHPACEGPEQHERNAYEPDKRGDVRCREKRVSRRGALRHGCQARGRRDFARGIDYRPGRAGIRVNGGARGVLHRLGAYYLAARDEAQRALNGKGQDKPQSDHGPEQGIDPLRRLFEDKPEQQHGQYQPGG